MTLLRELDSSTNPSRANQDSTKDAGDNEDIPRGEALRGFPSLPPLRLVSVEDSSILPLTQAKDSHLP